VNHTQAGKRPHFLIIGAGIAGCSLAYELSKNHSIKVSLLEAGTISKQGASSVPMALLNPHRGRTARATDLDLKGLNAMRQLAQELESLGLTHGMHFTGVLRIAHNEKQQKKFAKLHLKQLKTEDITAPYHAPHGGILIEEAGWLEPYSLLKALKDAFISQGGTVKERCKVEKIVKREDVLDVFTTETSLSADKVILAVGASHNPNLKLPEMERIAGDVIALDAKLDMPYPIAGAIYGMQNGNKVFMGGNHRSENEADPEAISRLKQSPSWFLKDLLDAPIVHQWSGVRAKCDDNTPLVKELEPDVWFFGEFGGRGFLCSYFLAQNLARLL